LKITDMYLLLF